MKDSSSPRQPPPPASTAAHPSLEAMGWGWGWGSASAHSVWGPRPHGPGKFFLLSGLHPTGGLRDWNPRSLDQPGQHDLGPVPAHLWWGSPLSPLGSTSPKESTFPGPTQDLGAWRGLFSGFGEGKIRSESPLPMQRCLWGLDPAERVASRG